MSLNGQKALIAGGATTFGSAHFCMQPDLRDPIVIHLHDIFELDLTTTCWVQAGSSTFPHPSLCSHQESSFQKASSSILLEQKRGLSPFRA